MYHIKTAGLFLIELKSLDKIETTIKQIVVSILCNYFNHYVIITLKQVKAHIKIFLFRNILITQPIQYCRFNIDNGCIFCNKTISTSKRTIIFFTNLQKEILDILNGIMIWSHHKPFPSVYTSMTFPTSIACLKFVEFKTRRLLNLESKPL